MSEHENTVLMAMSGGVDSSVSARLLMNAGYDISGLTMLLCCGEAGIRNRQDAAEAFELCKSLGIGHETLDIRDLFDHEVIRPFCQEYISGRTPNPCVICNQRIKFGYLHSVRQDMGYGYLATGHYANRVFNSETGLWELWRSKDSTKDQSYFLYGITQEQLSHTLFPLGEMLKSEVRQSAQEWGFSCVSRGESQDVCFIDDKGHVAFIESVCNRKDIQPAFEKGLIVDKAGNKLGYHSGLIRYTIGQRKGIGIAAEKPLYVIEKDVASNTLVVGFADDMKSSGVKVECVRIIGDDCLENGMEVHVKTHYRQNPIPAFALKTGPDTLRIEYAQPSKPAACGQACVMYDGERVIGGGLISESL